MTPIEVKGMSDADADKFIKVLNKAGATDIQKTQQSDGTFTVSFIDPDDDEDDA